MNFDWQRLGLPLALLGVVLAVAALGFVLARQLVRKSPDDAGEDGPTPLELLTKFREVHARGGLSDEEYRTIKGKLAAEVNAGLGNTNLSTGGAAGSDPSTGATQATPKG
jgi:5-bromo-4-chloroindolyl phosphate hydrolysis protein